MQSALEVLMKLLLLCGIMVLSGVQAAQTNSGVITGKILRSGEPKEFPELRFSWWVL